MKDPRLSAIFDAALQQGSNAQRAAYLDGACGPNAGLRDRVETLLRAHDAAGNFLPATTCAPLPEEGAGAVIGRYKLLQKVGEGGFGTVYMAEQLEPVRRKVAFKIIKLGMDTRQVVARFESERQALALMDHANIARVFDAGATESGRPYFVMELVRGIPITEYCDQNGLSTRDRLGLFITVCQAIQHAHQKGIIHRDIKPTNVMVTLHDGQPVPKVIDFGIAKATSQRLTEKTVFTEFRQIVGTPQYMSPEQAEMSGLDVDTRCDIYSLGVLLYELLTSTTPLEAEWVKNASYVELQRIIREEDPPRPSLRVSTMHEKLETIAKNRRVEPQGLSRLFRGDLDWIVMKALEKDRTRRYETARDLAADVERHLRDEPVEASPPSLLYKLRKFVRRNRTAATAGALVVGALLAGLVLATSGFVTARHEAARSKAIAAFLEDIVVAANPTDADGRQVDVEQVVRRARGLFGNDHATVAAALDGLGMQFQHAGDFPAAGKLYRESERIWRSLPGDTRPNLAQTLAHRGTLLKLIGDDADAETALREALELAATMPSGRQLGFCESRTELATLLQRDGRFDEAEAQVREALRIRRMHPESQQFRIASTLEQLTQLLIVAGRTDAADEVFAESLEAYRPLLPADSPTMAYLTFAYGHWLRQNGRNEKAEPHLREAVRIYRTMENPPREYYLAALDGLFQILRRRDIAAEETIAVFHECMHNLGLMFGTDHPHLGAHLFGFAKALDNSTRSADAIGLLVDGLRIYRKAGTPDWDPVSTLGMLERNVRRIVLTAGLASDKYQTALDGTDALLRDESATKAAWKNLRGMALYRLGRIDECLPDLAVGNDAAHGLSDDEAVQRLAFLLLAQRRAGRSELADETHDRLQMRLAGGAPAFAKDTLALAAECGQAIP
ncbi:MAG: serine/threonine protein kinase [Planctomycetaceae bacterium]|nr:serine/threonine protein kinase [Planctomycetaceae bacterium]